MAPEQARPSGFVDQRADVYAATAILHELLTGRPAFDADSLSDVAHRRDGAPRLGGARDDLPAGLQRVIDTGLAADPDDRFADARALAAAMVEAMGASGVVTPAFAGPPVAARARVAGLATRVGGGDLDVAPVVERAGGGVRIGYLGGPGARPAAAALVAAGGVAAALVDEAALSSTGVDVLVVAATAARVDGRSASLAPDLAGPVLVVDEGLLADERASAAIVATLTARFDEIVAAAALDDLETLLRTAPGGAAMRWVRCADERERLRFDHPSLAELDAVRALVAGRVVLPGALHQAAERILFEIDPRRRFGLGPAAADEEVRAAETAALDRWRGLQGSGRVAFAARGVVDIVVRALERRWTPSSP